MLKQKLLKKVWRKVKGTIFYAYKFCKYDNNNVYPYEYMDDWKKFNEALYLEKEDFYSHLNM